MDYHVKLKYCYSNEDTQKDKIKMKSPLMNMKTRGC